MTFTPRSLEQLASEWPKEIDHLSASSFKMAVRCPEQYRQRYMLGKRIAPNLAMLSGRADHHAIETSMVQKIETHDDLPVGEVRDAFVEKLEGDIEKEGGLGEIEVRVKGEQLTDRAAKTKELDVVRTHGPDVVEAYHRAASPFFQPVAVEKEFELHPQNLPVKIIGRIDLLAHEVQNTLLEVDPLLPFQPPLMIDRKRRARSSTRPEPEWTLQAEIYQLAEPVPHAWHISVTTKSPKVILPDPQAAPNLLQQVVPQERSARLVEQIAGSIGYYYMRYGPDQPWPAHGKLHSWACSYCGYKPNCWAWAE